ncbi:MAG: hypothetical protein HC904_04710 [Blastochloris sp.]|nr:hypothetical protein [Blastochloris sp.]
MFKEKSELFLYRLLWIGSCVTHTTSIGQSFMEGGRFSNSLLRQIQRLEKQQWLTKERHAKYGSLIRLSQQGLDVISDEQWTSRWQNSWDGLWTLVLFDISEKERQLRDVFRRQLQAQHFGCLQKSLWISPFLAPQLVRGIQSGRTQCQHLLMMQARELIGFDSLDLICHAWNLKLLSQQNGAWSQKLDAIEKLLSARSATAQAWDQAINEEFRAWKSVKATEPFLPRELQPKNYRTPQLWQRRLQLIQATQSHHNPDIRSNDRRF